MTMEIAIAAEPALINAGIPAEFTAMETPRNDNPIQPLDMVENPKVRSKLRLWAILSALYVMTPTTVQLPMVTLLTTPCSSLTL